MQKLTNRKIKNSVLAITFTLTQHVYSAESHYKLICSDGEINVSKEFVADCEPIRSYMELTSDESVQEPFLIKEVSRNTIKKILKLYDRRPHLRDLKMAKKDDYIKVLKAVDFLGLENQACDKIVKICDKKLKSYKTKIGLARMAKIMPKPILFKTVELHESDLEYASSAAYTKALQISNFSMVAMRLALPSQFKAKWSPDGTKFAALDPNGEIQIYDSSNGDIIRTIFEFSRSLKWVGNNAIVSTINIYGSKIIDMEKEDVFDIPFSTKHAFVKVSRNGSKVAIKKNGEDLMIYGKDGSHILTINKTSPGIKFNWSYDDEKIFVLNSNELNIFDACNGTLKSKLCEEEEGCIFSKAKWIDSNRIAVTMYVEQVPVVINARYKKFATLWNITDDKPIKIFENIGDHIIRASKDGGKMLLLNDDTSLSLLNTDGELLLNIKMEEQEVRKFADKIKLSHDGTKIISMPCQNKINIRSCVDGKILQTLSAREFLLSTWNRSTKGFLVMSREMGIQIWNPKKPIDVCKEYEAMAEEGLQAMAKRPRLT